MSRKSPNPTFLTRIGASSVWLYTLAACLIALLTAGALMLARPTDQSILATATADAECDLQRQTCSATFTDGGTVTLSFLPRPVKPVTGFTLAVRLDGTSADEVAVDLAGEGMDMGYNRPQLNSIDDSRFEGSAMLSVCTLDRMYWRATVLLTDERGTRAAPFRFETVQ